MGAFTQKMPGISPLLFPHLGDKKPERRIIAFNPASQIRVLKARTYQTRAGCQQAFWPVFFRHAEDLLKFTSARQSRKRIFNYFYPTNTG
jgi:hypothetical protein